MPGLIITQHHRYRGNLAIADISITTPGYWLVTPRGRFYISPNVDLSALEIVCRRELRESEGWEYWIDFCNGPDVDGRAAWVNLDLTERFF